MHLLRLIIVASAIGKDTALALQEIVWVRHACTYMNEYLGQHRPFAPGFTDVFPKASDRELYHDTQLSPYGQKQVRNRLLRERPKFCDDVDLVVTSPLRRTLQTLDGGFRTHLDPSIPIMAHPAAAERLYFVSDLGASVETLRKQFPWCTFAPEYFADQSTSVGNKDCWWWQHDPSRPYTEWRATGEGQKYACKSEPTEAFNNRMNVLYQFLEGQLAEYPKIAVVTHHGVIEWMLDRDFDNCQYQTIQWEDMQPQGLLK